MLLGYEQRILQPAFEWLNKRLIAAPDTTERKPVPQVDYPTIIICMTPRSGSSALSAAMSNTGLLGLGGERLTRKSPSRFDRAAREYDVRSVADFLRVILYEARSESGISQVKCDFLHILPFFVDEESREIIKQSVLIYLTREDLVAQAISLYKASATGYFHSVKGSGDKAKSVEYDFDGIWKNVLKISHKMAGYERVFAASGAAPLRVTYEAVNKNCGGILQEISERVGIDVSADINLESSGHKKIANEETEKLILQFRDDAEKHLVFDT